MQRKALKLEKNTVEIQRIAENLLLQLLMYRERKKLSTSNFVSIIIDGSTDSAMAENEMIYIQTCSSGSLSTNFIYCCQVECGTTSGIIDAIQ